MGTAQHHFAESDIPLFGKDATSHIVAAQAVLNSGRTEIWLYRREKDGDRITKEHSPFFPFFFLSEVDLLKGFPRERFRYQQLLGDNYYRYLIALTSWQTYWDAIRHIERATDARERRPQELYLVNNPIQQYLMQSGRTMFKGMSFDELHRLQLDIETTSTGGFPNADLASDKIIIAAVSDNRSLKQVLHLSPETCAPHSIGFNTETELLAHLVNVIREIDPDVIEGHNIYLFDFPYLLRRCERHGVPFNFGRDGSSPRSFPSSMRFAERTVDFPALDIAGRHVVDTYFLVLAFDVTKRDMPGYGLKAAARYFGFAPENRTYIEGNKITQVWQDNPSRLLDYALDDVLETERLARHLSGSTFYLTQMLPIDYGQVARTGPASKIEALFVREYLRQKQSLPKSEWGSQASGGYTDVFFTGVAGPIVYADVESLYPSIMLHYGIRPKGDTLNLFQGLLRRLIDLRFETKRQMKAASAPETTSELDARQSSFKVLTNSFYGQLGFSLALFNDFGEADRVTSTGRKILRQIISIIQREGGKVIEVDTDGVLFVPPDYVAGEAAEAAFIEKMNLEMPAGIRIGFDGRFQRMLSYKKKNYALLLYDGTLKYKGSSLVSRSNELFGRRFVFKAIELLINDDIEGLHTLYLETRDKTTQHDWSGVEDFSRTEALKDSADQYLVDVDRGRRPRAAAYELAIARSYQTRRPVRKGDRISYYVTGAVPTVTAFENCRLAGEWDPEQPDENTAYYLKRLDEFASKFEVFFSSHDFYLIFSPEDLFGFNPDGIRIISIEHDTPEVDEDVPF